MADTPSPDTFSTPLSDDVDSYVEGLASPTQSESQQGVEKRPAPEAPEEKESKAQKTEEKEPTKEGPPKGTKNGLCPPSVDQVSTTLLSMPAHSQGNNNPLAYLTEQQHQQLLQTYAQASGQDLANLTASSLAQAMVSPIAVPGLTQNLLQHLQGGNVITALPGPPPQIPPVNTPNNDGMSSDDGQSGKRGPNVRNMSNDERRQRRLLRNRVAAKECRKKKKQYIHEMEEKIQRLEDENARLHKEVEELNAKLTLGAMQGSESYRLMKEVEELNAKLGMGHLPGGSSALTAAVMAAAQQQHNQQSQHDSMTKNKAE
ncbi:hypothetical protein BDF14DRAFT_1877444 [Spinellus fusiger]|nr:hypothetical protein BDF14DRAFT_1877444 [Spinellus fusiger]